MKKMLKHLSGNSLALWVIAVLSLTASMCDEDVVNQDVDNPPPAEETLSKNHTILLYIMADNSLYGFAKNDLNELEKGMESYLSDHANVVVFVDDRHLPRILHYQRQKNHIVCDTVKTYEEDVCSVDPVVLQQVLDFTYNRYPARNYGLVMWSHGEGWRPATSKAFSLPLQQFIGIDNGSNSTGNGGKQMDIEDLGNVLERYEDLRFVMFDACFMQSVEVAYALRNSTEYLISSPMEIPGPGAPYHELFTACLNDESIDVFKIAQNYYNYYQTRIENGNRTYGVALSVIKCDELVDLAKETKQLIATYIRKEQGDIDLNDIFVYDYRQVPIYYDLDDLMRTIAPYDEYQAWYHQLKRTVPYAMTTSFVYSEFVGNVSMHPERFSGISTYIPKSQSRYTDLNEDFKQTEWYKDAGWGQTGW